MKKIFTVFLSVFMALTLIACGTTNAGSNPVSSSELSTAPASSAAETKYVDEAFITDMQKALEAGWEKENRLNTEESITLGDKVSDQDAKKYANDFAELSDTELEILSNYRNAPFKGAKLQEHATNYLAALDESKKACTAMTEDFWSGFSEWMAAYGKRAKVVKSLVNDYGLTVSDGYKNNLKQMLENDQLDQVYGDTQDDTSTEVTPTEKLPDGNYEETGKGTLYVVTSGGSTEDGIIPVIYIDPDEWDPSIEIDAWDFDGSILSYIYIDGELADKEQLGDVQMQLSLTDTGKKAGKHTVAVVQYENDDTSGKIVTYKSAQYEAKDIEK